MYFRLDSQTHFIAHATILGHGRALQSVGSPGDGSSSCEEWAGQERDKRASKSWSNGPPAWQCTQGHGQKVFFGVSIT